MVDDDGGEFAGVADAGGYEATKYPDLAPVLKALEAHGWQHQWVQDDVLILHHCGASRFVLLERDEYKRRWPATQLVALMTEAGGTLSPAPPLY